MEELNVLDLTLLKNYISMKGLTERYIPYIKFYINYLNTNNILSTAITVGDLSLFIKHLRDRNLADKSINCYIKAIRFYYKYLIDNNLCDESIFNVLGKVKFLKEENTIKSYLTKKELDEIVTNALRYDFSFGPHKIKALLYFLFYTGIRRNELINLMRKDVNLTDRTAIVRNPTKNRNERIVFYPLKVMRMLKEYFETEKEEINCFNLSRSRMDYFMKFLKNFNPPGKSIYPHLFRHSFANMLASEGIDIRIAQKLLGHKSIMSTMIYYDPDIKIIEKLYKKSIR